VFGNFAGQSGADVAITGGSITGLTELSTGTFTSTGIDDNATSTAITIDANENVGIGTASPSVKLDSHSNSVGVRATRASNTDQYIEMVGGDGAGLSHINANYQMAFKVGDSERARIDSSGNLLVGKTAENTATAGFQVRADGLVAAGRSGNPSAYFNRLSSDGDIAIFAKDGSTVGSIGTAYGDIHIGTGNTGMGFNNSTRSLVPMDTETNAFAGSLINLGTGSVKWKDLYLSGGVVFGDAGGSGTSTSNTLDSYEEGVWTPEIINHSGANPVVVYASRNGKYTKVGRQVTIDARISISSASGMLGAGSILAISGLPFAVGGGNYVGSCLNAELNFARELGRNTPLRIAGNNIGFLTANNNSGWGWEYTNILPSGVSEFRLTFTYFVD
jgi:hypothetical protein